MSFRASLVDDFIAESTINALVDTRVFDMFFEFEDFLNSKANAVSSFPAITIESDTGDTENNLDSHDNLIHETLSITIYQQVNLQKLRAKNPTVRNKERDTKRQVDTVADAVEAYILDKRGVIDTFFLRRSHISNDSDGVFETEGNREIVTREISYVVTYSKISAVPVNITVPVVTGDIEEGDLLTTSNGTWTNSPTSFTYKWLRDDVVISGATASTYTIVAADLGTTLKSQVIATDGGLPSLPAESIGTVIATIPINTVLPLVSGDAEEGSTLTTTNGTWDNSPTSFTYRWLRAGTPISGATLITYVSVSADVGNAITSEVTAINAAGSSLPAVSSNNIVVTAASGNVPEQLGATFAYDYIGANASTDIIEGATNVNVAGWKDITSNNNDAEQLTPSAQPTFTQTDGPIANTTSTGLDTGVTTPASIGTYIFNINTDAASYLSPVRILASKNGGTDLQGFFIVPVSDTVIRFVAPSNSTIDFTVDSYQDIDTTFSIVIDGTDIKLYQDGLLKDSDTLTGLTQLSVVNLFIGNRPALDQGFIGAFGGAYIFPTALDSSEITQMQTYIDGL